MSKFNKIIVAGTFDRLHSGHKKLLYLAFQLCNRILDVYICDGEQMFKEKKYANLIQPFDVRKENIIKYLSELDKNNDIKINYFRLSEQFPPSIYDETIDAIVVSTETIKGAEQINILRNFKNIKPIEILVVERNNDISSTYLRTLDKNSRIDSRIDSSIDSIMNESCNKLL